LQVQNFLGQIESPTDVRLDTAADVHRALFAFEKHAVAFGRNTPFLYQLLGNVNFGKNGYTQKWQNVIFDNRSMFSIEKRPNFSHFSKKN